MLRIASFVIALGLSAVVGAQSADATIKRIRDSRSIAIGYRTDALPFSYLDAAKQPAGYSVELCKRIVGSIEQQLKLQPLAIRWVATTSQNRLDLVQKRQIDMECGATTATLSRMERVDFSSPIFIDTTGVMARGAASLKDLAGKRIAVVAGTSNQKALEAVLKREKLAATTVVVKNREEALTLLEAGKVEAFAGDKLLLIGLARKLKDPSGYTLLDEDLAYEPYAIALARGDADMRLAVNRALSQIYDSRAIVEVFRGAFGAGAEPTPVLLIMYGISTFPE